MTTEDQWRDHFAEVGMSFLAMVANTRGLGHSAPGESLSYILSEPTFATDYTRWCAREDGWRDARDRVNDYFDANQLGPLFAGLYEKRMVEQGLPVGELLPYRKADP